MDKQATTFSTAGLVAATLLAMSGPVDAQSVRTLEFRIISDRTIERDGQRFSIFQSVETSVSVGPQGLNEQTVFRNFRSLAGRGGGRIVRQFDLQFPEVSSGVFRRQNGEWRLTATGATRVAALDEGARRITVTFGPGGRCGVRLAAAREEGRDAVRARSFVDGRPFRIISERPVDSSCRYTR